MGVWSDGEPVPYMITSLCRLHLTSPQWYRNKSYLYDGKYTDLDDFLRAEWEAGFLKNWDANDMLTLLRTWQLGDVSRVKSVGQSLQGDLAGVLSSITAKGLIMPSKTDLYFPVRLFSLLSSYCAAQV